MTKLLLSCDDYIYCSQGRFYAESQDRYDFYQRYLRVFDEIRLVARCRVEEISDKSRVVFDDLRIEVIPLPFFSGPFQYIRVYYQIGRCIRHITDGCNVAILRLPSTVAQRVADRVIRAGIPYALELVFDAKDAWMSATNLCERILWFLIHKKMVKTCERANGISCVTDSYMQKHYTSKKKDAFFSSYSSLALPRSFYSSSRPYPVKKEYVISHVSMQVQYDGRKGYKEMLAAMKILKDKNVDVRVEFAGPDYRDGVNLLSALSEKLGVADRVRFVGGLDRIQLSDYLEASDLYVMPTWAEGLPRVIIEAMAKGLPCITTPVSGNPELVSKCFLVEYADVETLADKIEALLTDKALYEAASRENFEKSLRYEATVLETRRDDFYAKLMACAKL